MMRTRHLLLMGMLVFAVACSTDEEITPRHIYENLNDLFEDERYFLFNSYLDANFDSLSPRDTAYFNCLKFSCFINDSLFVKNNRLLVEKYNKNLDSMESYHILKLRQEYYLRNNQYQKALEEVQLLMNNYSSLFDSIDLNDYEELNTMLSCLLEVDPPEKIQQGPTKVKLNFKNGHYRLPVVFGGHKYLFIMDSGSGKSLIRKSLALKSGMSIYPTDKTLISTTGKRINSQIAVADSIQIGNNLYKNIIFNCMEDHLLTFHDGEYVIDGLIGSEILSMNDEVIIRNDSVILRDLADDDYPPCNMTFRRQQLMFMLTLNGDTIPVKFDTGAYMSMFFAPLYNLIKDTLDTPTINTNQEVIGIGGSSSSSVIQTYVLENTKLGIDDTIINMTDIPVFKTYKHNPPEKNFGLMGNDFLAQFYSVSINFRANHITFTHN